MRKILPLLLILIFVLGCSSDDEKKEITLGLSVDILSFSANEDEKSFAISSNDSWVISNIPDWCTFSTQQGQSSAKITVKVSANPNESERKAVVTIKAGDKVKEITLKQNPKNVSLTLSVGEISFVADGEEKTFDIQSNELWTISEIPVWCTLDATEGSDNKTIKITANPNLDETVKEAVITVKAGSKSQQLKLKQEGMVYALIVSSPVLEFYSKDGSKMINIESNTSWEVVSGASWCIVNKQEGTLDEPLVIYPLDNESQSNRSTEVTISAGSVSIKILIKQSKKIPVTNESYQFNLLDNGFRTGDELIKKQVEYVNPGPAGENVVWDFSKLNIINDNYTVSYSLPPIELQSNSYILGRTYFDIATTEPNSLIVCTEHNTMYYFQVKNNQLQAYGHENPVVVLDYNPRMISAQYPTYYNNSYKYNYKSSHLYSGTVWGYNQGYMEMKADGYGSVKFPDGIVNNVIRTKNSQLISDGISPSIDSDKVMTIYRWYAKGYRYPIFEVYENVNLIDNSVIFSTAFYYPPKDHTYMNTNKKSTSIPLIDYKEINKKYEKLKFKH
ncbi:BACON domain-containing protein [uncultured Dysgonomonas sp.]|uniref:BACON domain-containing protein n=1 Tax=uncultured Dysgonomonas sp. TaxID=206096 RepID=A0A212K636_9BACT|nr:BACON domain-containing protein [uncultured Dysgonomonas sp.]SBW07184.1 exported hypothetical protein [uncultured Dysgonomonas sp.]